MAQVFISYSRKDKDFVHKIGDALTAQKRDAWVDWKDIPLTAEWQPTQHSDLMPPPLPDPHPRRAADRAARAKRTTRNGGARSQSPALD